MQQPQPGKWAHSIRCLRMMQAVSSRVQQALPVQRAGQEQPRSRFRLTMLVHLRRSSCPVWAKRALNLPDARHSALALLESSSVRLQA